MIFPHGFGIPLADFAFTVWFAWLAQQHFRPSNIVQWAFFVLSIAIALLFFVAWIIDLGAHL